MRLLVVTAAYPGAVEPERGIFIENLNRALLEKLSGGLDLTVVTPRVHAEDPLDEERAGVSVRRFRYPSGGRRLKEIDRPSAGRVALYLASALRRSLAVASREAYDAILAHWVLPAGVVGAAVSSILETPLIVHAHGSDMNRYARRPPARWLARWPLRRARRVLCVSRELARRVRLEHGVEEGRIELLPMGVAPEFSLFAGSRDADRRELGLEDGLDLLFVGDLTAEKGMRELVGALETLRREGVPARLHIAGGGPLAEELAALEARGGADGRADLPPGAIHLLGRLPPAELARWYRAADLLVHPSHSEGSPVAVMEALASGLPVVATAVGGVPDLVEEERTGRLVFPRDPQALARAIGELHRHPERLDEMRRRLREHPPELGMSERAGRLLEILEEVVSGGGGK